ncbi:Polyphosphate kinase OS=Streptomyces glaucescens OX=1907 GN=ppk PE=3 SV=1 [Streptomyces glaucescens]
MKPAVPEPSPPPEGSTGNGTAAAGAALPPAPSDAPVSPLARKNGSMSQQNAQAPVPQVQHAQPSVGSIAAHRPHTVAAAVSDLEPDIDADLDSYEETHGDGGQLPQGRFLDRERSWLAFNERVLELAEDPETPLLERANFLAIFASNLDEFFMVRVAGLKRRIATGVATRSASGLQPREVLEMIWARSRELMARHAACYHEDVAPALAEEGIHLVRWSELTEKEQARLFTLFKHQIFPVLTPLAVDPAHPFPYISGLSLNLAVVVRNPVSGHKHFARVKVPPLLSRFLESSPGRYVPIEDVIAAHLEELFPGMEVLEHHAFRLTRNEDLEVEEDDTENLLQALEKELMRRRFGPPVRLEVEESIDREVLDLLVRELKISEAEVYPLPGPLDLTGLFRIHGLDRPELKYPKFIAGTHRDLAEVESASAPDIFAALRQRDVLLHHPYDSFSTSVQAFLEQAAQDPDVLAIKQTLYRTSGDSPIVDALIDAAESGKQVLVLVEIKARFDEHANIKWARKLEEAGLPRGLRPRRPQDPLQAVARRPPGGRYAPALQPRRHRQLPPQDRAALRGPGPAHRRPPGRRGPLRPVQPPLRLLPPRDLPAPAGRPQVPAGRPDLPHRQGDPAPPRRTPRPRPHQGQLHGGRGRHRRLLPGVPGGRAGRHLGARHVRPYGRA